MEADKMDEATSGGTPAVETPKNDFKEHDPAGAPKAEDLKPPQPKAEKPASETAPEGEEHPDDGSDEGDKKRGRGGFQKKIARLSDENTALKARLDKLEGAKPSEQPKPETKAPEASNAPKPEDFKTYEEYLEARSDWKSNEVAEKKFKERDDQAKKDKADADQREYVSARQTHMREGIQALTETVPDLVQRISDYDGPTSPTMEAAVMASDESAKVALYLLDNPEAAEKLAAMSISQANKFVGRIEGILESQEKSQGKAAVRTTGAPPPVKPVGKGKPVVDKDPNDMSFEEHKAWRAKQRGK